MQTVSAAQLWGASTILLLAACVETIDSESLSVETSIHTQTSRQNTVVELAFRNVTDRSICVDGVGITPKFPNGDSAEYAFVDGFKSGYIFSKEGSMIVLPPFGTYKHIAEFVPSKPENISFTVVGGNQKANEAYLGEFRQAAANNKHYAWDIEAKYTFCPANIIAREDGRSYLAQSVPFQNFEPIQITHQDF